MALAIVTTSGTVTYTDPTAGFHGTGGTKALLEIGIDAGEYAIEPIPAAGVEGVGTALNGFRSREIGPFSVMYIGATSAAAMSLYEADHTTMKNQAASVTVHGTAYPACYLTEFKRVRGPKNNEKGTFALTCSLAFKQKRLA